MRQTFNIRLLLGFAAFLALVSNKAFGQIITSVNETTDTCAIKSYRSLSPINTKVDACLLPGNEDMISVSVWDGRDGGIGWRLASGGNSHNQKCLYFRSRTFTLNDTIYYARGLKDPDVTVGRNDSGSIYAVVAGVLPFLVSDTLASNPAAFNKVILLQYKYVAGTFQFIRACGPYGQPGSGIECKSPSVDGNSRGDFVLSWHEQEAVTAQVSASLPSGSVSQNLSIKRGNVVSVEGQYLTYWNGTNCPSCLCGDTRRPGSSLKEDRIGLSNEAQNFWVDFEAPDVSISERFSIGGSDSSAIKSYVFYRKEHQGGGYLTKLVLVQVRKDSCYRSHHGSYTSQNNFSSYPFRHVFDSLKVNANFSQISIAAPPGASGNFSPGECTIVVSDSSTKVYQSIANYDSYVWLLGKRTSGMLNGGVPKALNIAPYINHYGNYNPSLTYTQDSIGATRLHVVWELSNSPHNILERNVISRVFSQDGAAISPYYGFINKNTYANQGSPAVAGRKLIAYKGSRKPCTYGFYTHYPSLTNAYMGVRSGFSHIQPGIRRFNFQKPNMEVINAAN